MNMNFREIAERMATTAAAVNVTSAQFEGRNRASNPFFSQLQGMTELLKTMDIRCELERNEDVTKYTAIIVAGERVEVKQA